MEEKKDGRNKRQETNKTRVVRAMLKLIQENSSIPTVENVAIEADLSRRTVFRLFNDQKSLFQAAMEMMTQEVMRRFPPPPPGQPSAIELLISHRADFFEYIMPMRRIVDRIKSETPAFKEEIARTQEMERAHLVVYFGELLPVETDEREEFLDIIQMITSWNNWIFLRDDCGYSVEKSKGIIIRALKIVFSYK